MTQTITVMNLMGENEMKRLFLVFIVCILANGCSLMQKVPIVGCGDSEGSIIQKLIPDPRTADMVLNLANYEGLDRGIYTKAQVEKFFDKIEKYCASTFTYNDLAVLIMKEVDGLADKIGPRFIIASSYLNLFLDQMIPISEYDRCLILKHIKNQRKKVLVFF